MYSAVFNFFSETNDGWRLVIDTTMSLWLGLVETVLLQVVQDPEQYV